MNEVKWLKIAFLLPVNAQAGGIFVVYVQAIALMKSGHDVTILFKHYRPEIGLRSFGDTQLKTMAVEEIPKDSNFDLVIATWWETFYDLHKVPAKMYAYFVQSDERRFYNPFENLRRKWVELTYSFPEIPVITEAKWIQAFLERDFGLTVSYAPNGIDNTVFNQQVVPLASRSDKVRVLIEGPGGVEYKRLDDAFKITNSFPGIEVWCVCNDMKVKPEWRIDRLFGQVPFTEMPSIYKSCDILIKMSSVEGFFGPPLEMMATGGACLVSDVTGFDEYIVNEENGLVVPIGDIQAGISALNRLVSDPQLRQKLGGNGLMTATKMDWTIQSPKFEKEIMNLWHSNSPTSDTAKARLRLLSELRELNQLEIRRTTSFVRYKIVDAVGKLTLKFSPRLYSALRSLAISLNSRLKLIAKK